MSALQPDSLGFIAALVGAHGSRDVARALQGLASAAGFAALHLYRLDPDQPLLHGVPHEGRPSPAIPQGDHPCWRALATGEPAPGDAGATWPIAVPLSAADAPSGVVLVELADEDRSALDPWLRLLALAGPALARGVAHDRLDIRSRALDQAIPLLSDGFLLVTTDGEVLGYGGDLVEQLGWSLDEVRAQGWTNLVYPDPQDRADALQAIAALAAGRPSEGIVRSLASKDGGRVRGAVYSRLVPHPAGAAPAMVGVLRDVTDAEEARRAALREESLAHLGRLSRSIAHDFNNLLCAVLGQSELIQLTSREPATVDRARLLQEAAEDGAALTRQLLAFGGRGPGHTHFFDLGQSVRRVCDLFRVRLPAGVVLQVRQDREPSVVEADEGQLHQAVTNLLVNSLLAVEGGGRLTVEVGAAGLPEDLAWRAESCPPPATRMARVEVRDDGPGFEDRVFEHLFDPFFTTRAEGHGVGLPAVRGVVANHGGALQVYNDGGAVVVFYLPLAHRPEPPALPGSDVLHAARGRVWVLDDQVRILEFSRVSLGARGHEVQCFDTERALVDEARALPPERWPEVLVLDAVMPQGGGPAVLPKLRALGLDAPVLWVSGHVPPEQGVLPDPEHFLQKPYTGTDLALRVEEILQGVWEGG